MDTVSDKPAFPVVVCGAGRIGSRLGELLHESKVPYIRARLDSRLGLISSEGELPSSFKVLVICISAGHKSANGPRWHWDEVLLGLVAQIRSQEIRVESVVLVSSSRVYESYDTGLVTATCTPQANSAAGKALITAEQQLLSCPMKKVILNCSGLYGASYSRYTPIMLAAKDKPRFGIDADQVAHTLSQLVQRGIVSALDSKRLLLTDEKVYFQQQKLTLSKDKETVETLAQDYRILVNSEAALE